MLNNDVLRSIRYTLNLSDSALLDMLHDVEPELDIATLRGYLASEEDESFVRMDDELMVGFLDSLILSERGPSPHPAPATELPLTNNTVLKKLRVAFALHEIDLIDILRSVDFDVSKPELSALFRKPGHNNYRECGDQLLRQFLKGLTLRYRPDAQ
ncbi:DUF1456 family protein [Pseudomonas sp. C27(2019)]|uniref:DUF1456 family protein n=1 Tax=Pseudomonas sp. C27(2019) TaxID=2604941 RepID=UPI001248AB61|nr:DUF1456 family protein [Pseudomonas sp. C27(2019)]QEY58570.1 DUF1456 family protein [Pseudomonas sp. C27(2019)]